MQDCLSCPKSTYDEIRLNVKVTRCQHQLLNCMFAVVCLGSPRTLSLIIVASVLFQS